MIQQVITILEDLAAVKLTEKNDAQGNHDAEIDSLNDEQDMIQQVITILEDLLGRQANWIQCASEGGICYCNGNVRYGVDDKWSKQQGVDGQIECSNGVFGDPANGIPKFCECDAA